MDNLISREEVIKAITNDNGIQYPRWWYLEKIKAIPLEPDLISKQQVIDILKDRRRFWHDERATAAINDCIFEIEHKWWADDADT